MLAYHMLMVQTKRVSDKRMMRWDGENVEEEVGNIHA